MKALKVASLLVIVAVLLTACAPAAASLVALPEEARLLILSLVTAGLTWLLLQLSAVLKIDLSGYAGPLAAVIAPVLITLIESYLQMIPPVFDDLVLTVIHFLVLLLGSLGAYLVVGKTRNRQVKQLLA